MHWVTDFCVTLYKSLVWRHLGYVSVVCDRNREFTANYIDGVQKNFLHWIANSFNLLGHDMEVTKALGLSWLWTRSHTDFFIFLHRLLLRLCGLSVTTGLLQVWYTKVLWTVPSYLFTVLLLGVFLSQWVDGQGVGVCGSPARKQKLLLLLLVVVVIVLVIIVFNGVIPVSYTHLSFNY